MGSQQAKEEKEENANIEMKNDVTNYKDAITSLSTCLHKYGKHSEYNDEKKDIASGIQDLITKSIANGLKYPSWMENKEEDQNLQEHIASLQDVTPDMLEAKFLIKDENVLTNISLAIHELAKMTEKEDPFDKLTCIVDCCHYAIEAVGPTSGADELIPALIYVILKSNPPKLYSSLTYLSCFLDMNGRTLNSTYEFTKDVPRLFGTIMDCCFANIQFAVTIIKGMKYNGESEKQLEYDKLDFDYIEAKYTDELNTELLKDIEEHFTELMIGLKALMKVRILIRDNHREDMEKIADTLDGHKRNVLISKAVGLSFAIGGGAVSIIGFGLMFTTFGVSSILIPVGAAIGGAGGMTAGIAGFVEYGINRSTAKDIQAMRDDYEKAMNEVFLCLQKIEKTVNNIWSIFRNVGNASKILINFVDVIMKVVRIAVVFQDVADTGVNAFRAASTAGRALSIAGVVFSAILLPIDMIFFGITLKDLAQGEKAKQAIEIRTWLNQELPTDNDIEKTVLKLKTGLLDFLKEVQNNNTNEKLISEGEEHLKQCFDEVTALIDKTKETK